MILPPPRGATKAGNTVDPYMDGALWAEGDSPPKAPVPLLDSAYERDSNEQNPPLCTSRLAGISPRLRTLTGFLVQSDSSGRGTHTGYPIPQIHVGTEGLEPSQVTLLAPKASASANSATCPCHKFWGSISRFAKSRCHELAGRVCPACLQEACEAGRQFRRLSLK